MPIVVQHQPDPGVLGAAGVLAGNADYQRWLAQFRFQQQQEANRLAMQRAQMAQDQMQSAQRLQAGMQEAGMRNQTALLQGRLNQRDDLQKMLLGQRLNAEQFAFQQPFLYERDRLREMYDNQQLQARLQQQAALQMVRQQQQAQQQELADVWNQFKDPYGYWNKIVAGYQQQGLQFDPRQQADINEQLNTLRGIRAAYDRGDMSRSDAIREMRPLMGKLRAMEPSPAPPDLKTALLKKIVMDFPGLEGVPVTVNKDGEPEVIRNWKADGGAAGADETAMNSEKTRGLELKNKQTEMGVKGQRMKHIRGELNKLTDQWMKALGVAPAPEQIQQWKMELGAEWDEAMASPPIPTGTPAPGTPGAPVPGSPPGGAPAGATAPATGAPVHSPDRVQAAFQQALPQPQQQAAALEWVKLSQQFGNDASKWPPDAKARAEGILQAIMGAGA